MKIAYVGNRTNLASDGKSFNTENHIALTLERLGHEVDFIQENLVKQGTLADRIKDSDLFLWTRTWKESDGVGYVSEADLKAIKELNITTASFHLDKYTGIQRDGGIATDVFWKTNFVFSPEGSPEAKAIFKGHGINQYYLPAGVFEGDCYATEPVDIFRHDVVFVGIEPQYGHKEWPYRGQLIKFLRDTYSERFIKKGHPQETVRNEKLNWLYANSKVVVGDSLCLNFTHPYYWSDRVYETLGRGGFLIHPFIEGLDEEFEDKKHLVYYKYGDFDQLKSLIDYYLDPAHYEEREAIRLAGFEFVKNHATYTDRMKQMIGMISGAVENPTLSAVPPITPIKINLGSGSEPELGEDWVNVDWVEQDTTDVVHNLLEFPWPFADGVADEMLARDVLEHMPLYNLHNQSIPIKFIEECHRILQTGGKLFMTMPHWQSPNLWIDPTHVRGYDEKSFDYFDPETDYGKWYGYYSDKKFKVTSVRTPNNNVEFTMVKR